MNVHSMTHMYAIVDAYGNVAGDGEIPFLWAGSDSHQLAQECLDFMRTGHRDEDTGDLLILPRENAEQYRIVKIEIQKTHSMPCNAIQKSIDESRAVSNRIRDERQREVDRMNWVRRHGPWYRRAWLWFWDRVEFP